jgi:ABC-type sugar transport system ATPase subunit
MSVQSSRSYRVVHELAESGCAVLFRSGQLVQYDRVRQRVMPMRRGRIVAWIIGESINEDTLLHAVNADANQGVAGSAPADTTAARA